jgi:hypothetical protein
MLVHPRMSAFEAKRTIIGYRCHVAEGPSSEVPTARKVNSESEVGSLKASLTSRGAARADPG